MPLVRPVLDFFKIPTSVNGICFQDKIIANELPFHWGEIGVALKCLAQVIDAVASIFSAEMHD